MSDLIKREDAINSIYKLKKTVIKQDVLAYCDGLFDALEIVQGLPSVDRPSGEWVPFEYGDERWHKCTACGVADKYIEYVERPNGTTGKLVAIRNFCPNCGARMKGADDE